MTGLPKPNVRWRASLSTGDTITEGVGNFEERKGELSPWRKLLRYIDTHENVSITSLSLIYKDHTFNLPSAGNNPRFKKFDEEKKPIGYNFFRHLGTEQNNRGSFEVTDHFTVIEAIYPSYRLQLWVNELDPRHTWALVKGSNG